MIFSEGRLASLLRRSGLYLGAKVAQNATPGFCASDNPSKKIILPLESVKCNIM